MTFRTKSRGGQWAVWFGAALVALAAYVILSRAFYGTFSWSLLIPRQFRLAAPLLALLLYIAKETRWDGITRETEETAPADTSHRTVATPPVGRDVPIAPPAPPAPVQSPTSTASVRCPSSSVPTNDVTTPTAAPPTNDQLPSTNYQLAARLWDEARAMTHRYIPDPEKDADYLAKLHGAANVGHLEAMAKLGDYAFRRNAFVEAYYWTALAELKGATGLEESLRKIKAKWLASGCPTQYGNVSLSFTEEQGSFARALLRIRCAIDTPIARARMRELADQGVPEAQLFLNR